MRTGPTCIQRNFSQRDSSPKRSPAARRMRKKRIVMSCQAVLCLPRGSAGRIWPWPAASWRRPVIRNSRVIITITAHAGRAPSGMRQIRAEATRTLSASGSMSFPKFVIWLNFLAKYPSSQSVSEAIMKSSSATTSPQCVSVERKATKNTVRIRRPIVRRLGRFIDGDGERKEARTRLPTSLHGR